MGNRSSSTGSTGSLSGSNTGRPLEQHQRQSSQSSLFEQLTTQAKDLVREGTRQSSQDRLLAHMDKVTRAITLRNILAQSLVSSCVIKQQQQQMMAASKVIAQM